ncbi:MAG: DUF933 domain-containing protein [Verrucomicrobia bacterium]|jgi:hypothetical protein|nr:DUF933 domain-containing protein [Verrucomicrobiota bacterium]
MKICLFGISGIPIGRHNVKDPRLDTADRLVEAKKKTPVQVDVVNGDSTATADVLAATADSRLDLILRDLEFVETRLGRNPDEPERTALLKLQTQLERDGFVADAVLSSAEREAVAVHSCFLTSKPVVIATAAELAQPEALILRAYQAGGFISFLTVGGKENRAWMIRRGATAWEAAGAIHSDIQRGFIRAEVISYADLVAHGGETGAKRAGCQRLEGKTYVMQDYDVVNFRFNK